MASQSFISFFTRVFHFSWAIYSLEHAISIHHLLSWTLWRWTILASIAAEVMTANEPSSPLRRKNDEKEGQWTKCGKSMLLSICPKAPSSSNLTCSCKNLSATFPLQNSTPKSPKVCLFYLCRVMSLYYIYIYITLLETNVTPKTEKRKPGSTFICKKRLLQEQKTNHFRSLR